MGMMDISSNTHTAVDRLDGALNKIFQDSGTIYTVQKSQ